MLYGYESAEVYLSRMVLGGRQKNCEAELQRWKTHLRRFHFVIHGFRGMVFVRTKQVRPSRYVQPLSLFHKPLADKLCGIL